MHIIHMRIKITFITDQMFPESPLPDTPFTAATRLHDFDRKTSEVRHGVGAQSLEMLALTELRTSALFAGVVVARTAAIALVVLGSVPVLGTAIGLGGFGALVVGGQFDSPMAREDIPERERIYASGMFFVGFRGNIVWGVPAAAVVATHALTERLVETP